MLNFSGILYMSGSFLVSSFTYRMWSSYQKTKNLLAKNFAYIGFFVALPFFIFGLSCFLFSQNPPFLKIGGSVATFFLFLGCIFGLRVFLSARLERFSLNFVSFLMAFFGIITLFLQAAYPGYPQMNQGIVEWNIGPTPHLLFTILVLVFVVPLTIVFIRSGFQDRNVRIRSFLMGGGFFLGGIGAILNSSSLGRFIIIFGGLIMFLSFLLFILAFFFTKPLLE